MIAAILWNLSVISKNNSIAIIFPKHNLKIYAEIADNNLEREKGLMGRNFLAQNRGMLFIFDSEAPQSFWMKNTLFPLDIAFMSEEGKIMDIKENFQPCESDICETYISRAPAKYALEINAGLFRKHGVSIGDFVKISRMF